MFCVIGVAWSIDRVWGGWGGGFFVAIGVPQVADHSRQRRFNIMKGSVLTATASTAVGVMCSGVAGFVFLPPLDVTVSGLNMTE